MPRQSRGTSRTSARPTQPTSLTHSTDHVKRSFNAVSLALNTRGTRPLYITTHRPRPLPLAPRPPPPTQPRPPAPAARRAFSSYVNLDVSKPYFSRIRWLHGVDGDSGAESPRRGENGSWYAPAPPPPDPNTTCPYAPAAGAFLEEGLVVVGGDAGAVGVGAVVQKRKQQRPTSQTPSRRSRATVDRSTTRRRRRPRPNHRRRPRRRRRRRQTSRTRYRPVAAAAVLDARFRDGRRRRRRRRL